MNLQENVMMIWVQQFVNSTGCTDCKTGSVFFLLLSLWRLPMEHESMLAAARLQRMHAAAAVAEQFSYTVLGMPRQLRVSSTVQPWHARLA